MTDTPPQEAPMALYRCDAGQHRYAGPQRTMYPALVNQGDATRRKLRLCGPHFRRYMDYLSDHAQNAQRDFDSVELTKCAGCSNEVTDSDWQFFVTVYDHKAEREDWWAPVHEDCAFALASDWLMDVDTL